MQFSRRFAIAALLSVSCVMAYAQERGTREEAKAMTDAAFDHIKKVGEEQAYKDFTTDKAKWVKKDMYVQVYNNASINQAHGGNPQLVGKDMTNVRDANGVNLVPDMIKMAAKGGGWVDYDWPDPITKKVMAKSTYVRKQPNGEGFVGVGVYR
ncbi:cache domain-containing protein [Curvibacter sp. CHRR-16]|uniref:cache domain-containing protein n=1 Tax=Curvibacter sp. CHRR-16 TaxID=2835872 RepID=UPI001BD964B4|nr:cache domain-containing protein [Curvibacter sp. CHRR-16]MBT0569606.1 cache domain-containing protein [Curvibacter sp. CHRR-16]